MNKMNKVMIALLCLSLTFACFCGCETFEREYNDDIVYELQNGSDVIIIKEWSFLLGSGAEIYFKKGDEKPVLLGQTSGGDDGFCPFEAGLYEIRQDGNSICVSWCIDSSDNDRSHWHSENFDLPWK